MGYGKLQVWSIFSCIFLLVAVTPAEAQQHHFKKYSVNHGLPHSQIHGLHQTHDGYLWVGSYGGGLAKFDGQTFTTYTTEDGLRDNSIEIIFEDSKQDLWVTTYKSGIARMEGESFEYPIQHSVLDTSYIYAVDEMSSGDLWIGTYRSGAFIWDGSQVKRLSTEDGLLDNAVWDFWEDEEGNIWIATNSGISILDGNELKEGVNFHNFASDDGFSGEEVYRIAPRKNGEVWLATSNGITIWDGDSFLPVTEIEGIEMGAVYDLISASDGTMWIGTYSNGVITYSEDSVQHFTSKKGLSSNYIYDLHEDQDENIWIATDEAGINRYEGGTFTFLGTESGLISPDIYSLHRDNQDRIWVGTREGIYKYQDDTFETFDFPSGYESPKEVWEIAEFANGDLLFLMPDDAIYKYDGQTFTNYSEAHNFDLWFTFDLYVDEHNTLWIATEEGVFHQQEDGLTHYTTNDGLASNIVYQIYPHKGYLWMATYNGISRFDGEEFTNYTTADGINHRDISYITSDEKGNLWLGTGGGVTFLELNEQAEVTSIDNFDKDVGMESEATQMLWFDNEGMLWQGTNGGIHRLDVPKYHATDEMHLTYHRLTDHGMGIETNHKAILPLPNNRALFGTTEGLLEINPDNMKQGPKNLNVHISDIQRNSQQIPWHNYADSLTYKFGRLLYPEATFPYGQHTYTFEYEAPFMGNASNISYRYKLEGFQEKWSDPTNSQTAVFTNLDPGNYKFVVQAKHRSTEWTEDEAHFEFAVAYPFWQTYWFYALTLCFFGGLVYGYIRLRLYHLEKQRLQERVEEQTRYLLEALEEKEVLIKEIHHRVKNNLAVISGLLELQMGHADDEFVSRVLLESQRRVQSISMIHEKLYQNERLAEIDFEKYVNELIRIIAYSFGNPDKEIEVDVKVGEFKLGVDQGIPCGLILNELVSNAYEHAFKKQANGTIKIHICETDDHEIKLLVADDGQGLPEDFNITNTDSLGLTLVDTLCKQLEGTFQFRNTPDGAEFVLRFQKEEPSLKVPA